jgi:hypothetical protein
LHWGDKETRKMLGTVLMAEIVEIREDPGNACKFTLVAVKRTLVLEASDAATAAAWVRALRFFVDFKERI